MPDNETSSLSPAIGADDLIRLAKAYDVAISIISLGDSYFVPTRDARRAMLNAMLESSNEVGFDEDRLVLAALASGGVTPMRDLEGCTPDLGLHRASPDEASASL